MDFPRTFFFEIFFVYFEHGFKSKAKESIMGWVKDKGGSAVQKFALGGKVEEYKKGGKVSPSIKDVLMSGEGPSRDMRKKRKSYIGEPGPAKGGKLKKKPKKTKSSMTSLREMVKESKISGL